MNNWRLLLLAVVVVVQPIGSFTESNLIDGRECCERSEDARLNGYRKTDERRSLDGNRGDRRTAYEERRLRSDVREDRRYETTRGPILTRSESLERNGRRFSPELSRSAERRLVREQERRYRDTFVREVREDQNHIRDESRNILGQNERDSRQSRNRDALDASRTLRLSRDERDTHSIERESRNTMSRLPIRTFRSDEERRSTENKERFTDKRENIARSDVRRDSRLSASTRADSRLQLDDNRDRRLFDRRTEEDGTEFRSSRVSDARLNEVRAVQTQRSIEQNEMNNRNFEDTKAELRKDRSASELRDRIIAVRRESERYSIDRARESRLVGDRMENRINERIDERRQQRESRLRLNYSDTNRNNDERRVDARETRATIGIDMNTRNDVRMEQRSTSLDNLSMLRGTRVNRLSRSSERNIRDVSDGSSDERNTNRFSIANTETMQETRRTITDDIREPSEERRQREVRNSVEQRQEARIVSRRDVRESSDERRQQRDVSQLSRDRTISAERETRNTEQESRKNMSERPEQRRLQNSRASRSTSSVRVIRDTTDRESRNSRESAEHRERENYFSRDRVSMLREKRDVRDSSKRTQEARKIDGSDLRRHVLERSMVRARMTHTENEELINNARESRARSVDASRTREDTRINELETQGRDRVIKQVFRNVAIPRQESHRSSQRESIRLERVVRNRDVRESGAQDRTNRILEQARSALSPQRVDTRRSSRTETIRLERLVRNRAEARENERQDMQREKRDVHTFSDRRSSERFAERRQERQENRESVKDSREVRMARNRDEVRGERVLTERRQQNRESGKDSRDFRITRNRDEVRGERVLAEQRQENRESAKASREVRMARNRDEVRDERVLAERIQENRESVKDSREVRMIRNRDEIRGERVLTERRQENRESGKDSREVRMTRNRDEVRGERILAERRQENQESVKDSREVRFARNRDEVRGARVLAERRQENRDATRDSSNIRETRNRDLIRSERTVRNIRGEMMTERSDSRQRDAMDFRSQRETHVNELTERSRDSGNARSSERHLSLRADVRESKNDVRGSKDFVLERSDFEREGRRESLRSNSNMSDALVQEDEPVSNWQMIFYTLQGVYLCGLLVQMLTENANKKQRSFNWWSSSMNLIKVD